MSVPKYKRGYSKLRVITLGNELVTYLLHMVCNEKIFPKKMRWLMAEKIADLANDFHSCIWIANELNVEDTERLHLQEKALALLSTIESKIIIACAIFKLSKDKMTHLAKLLYEETKLIHSWINSDKKRITQDEQI